MPAISAKSSNNPFGSLLRRYRTERGLSQERLAADAEVSTRHLSCLETGRAAPSRTMVLVVGSALDLPLRDRNLLLEAAGFVAAYRDVPIDAPEAASLRQAIDQILGGFEPNGAVACDRAWNLLQMNQAATRLFATFVDLAAAPPEVMTNVVVATLHPAGLRPAIVNFDDVAAVVLDRARREIARAPGDPEFLRVRDRLRTIADLPSPRALAGAEGPYVAVHLRRGDREARIFSMIATLGTPIDATAEDLRIEAYLPADDATRRLFRDLADSS